MAGITPGGAGANALRDMYDADIKSHPFEEQVITDKLMKPTGVEKIGKQLFISPETVRTHVRKAMTKLDADTRTQAVATALRQSLIA